MITTLCDSALAVLVPDAKSKCHRKPKLPVAYLPVSMLSLVRRWRLLPRGRRPFVMFMLVMVRRSHIRLRFLVPAMAGSATDRFARVVDLADIVRIDAFHHRVHQPGRGLFLFGVIGKIQARLAVRSDVFRVWRV